MKCNYRSWKRPAHQIKAWQMSFKEKVRKTKSFVHILMQRTGTLFASCVCLRSEHRETIFWSSWESTRTPTRVKLTLGNVNNGFTLWNNKILLKIKLENKGHTKLNVRTLVGAVALWGQGLSHSPRQEQGSWEETRTALYTFPGRAKAGLGHLPAAERSGSGPVMGMRVRKSKAL